MFSANMNIPETNIKTTLPCCVSITYCCTDVVNICLFLRYYVLGVLMEMYTFEDVFFICVTFRRKKERVRERKKKIE